jgi:preprotein translocase subunit SecA
MYRVLNRLGPGEGEALEHRMLSGVVERAQKKVEELNFMRRKNVLQYDEVMNEQRRVIYEQRRRLLEGEDFGDQVREMVQEVIEGTVTVALADTQYAEDWDIEALLVALRAVYDPSLSKVDIEAQTAADEVAELAVDDALGQYDEREKLIGEEQMRAVERAVMLSIVDVRWKDHLLDMDYMQEGIHLRALGQRDPLAEYKTEGYSLFEDMLGGVRQSVVMTLMKNSPEDLAYFAAMTFDQPMLAMNYTSGEDLAYQTSFAGAAGAVGAVTSTGGDGGYGAPAADQGAPAMAAQQQMPQAPVAVQQRHVEQKVGRNDPCWCGSGKKFKKCHGA